MSTILPSPLTALPLIVSAFAFLLVYTIFFGRRNANAPPGPRPLPLIGNLHQLPSLYQHLKLAEWAAQYGDIVFAKLAHQPVLILSSARDAAEIMEKRGAKYSDRPPFTYLNALIEWTAGMPWMPYNDMWKLQRKWMQHAVISRTAINHAQPIQRRESHRLLLDLLRNPADFRFHLKRFVVAVIFELGYGRTISTLDDDFIRLVERGVSESLEGSGSGSALVDLFPILRLLPAWVPGADFRRAGERSRQAIRAVEDIPYDQVRREMAEGIAKPSMAKSAIEDHLENDTLTEEIEYQIKGAAGLLYVGKYRGTDTTLTAILVFVFEMMMHPDILKKAQEEIDLVVGNHRLPDFEDRPSLPYLECIVREVFRFFPPVPLGVTHQSIEDDVFRGYEIPKGCNIVPNIWSMMRDPELYPEPEAFRPERFAGASFDNEASEVLDPRKVVFGFGRRVCPGRSLADNNLWLVLSRMIATMDIGKARDNEGKEITPLFTYTSGIVSHPGPFPCNISPRSEKARQLILECSTDL